MEAAMLEGLQIMFGSPVLDRVMPWISWLANHGQLWLALAAVLLARKRTRACGVALALALLCSGLFCNVLLKPLVDRPRPFEVIEGLRLLIPPPGDASFPSGHTSISFAAAGALTCLGKRWAWPAFILAGLIAFSRLYLCVHWPSDVLAGIALGLFSAFCGKWCLQRLRPVLQKANLIET